MPARRHGDEAGAPRREREDMTLIWQEQRSRAPPVPEAPHNHSGAGEAGWRGALLLSGARQSRLSANPIHARHKRVMPLCCLLPSKPRYSLVFVARGCAPLFPRTSPLQRRCRHAAAAGGRVKSAHEVEQPKPYRHVVMPRHYVLRVCFREPLQGEGDTAVFCTPSRRRSPTAIRLSDVVTMIAETVLSASHARQQA